MIAHEDILTFWFEESTPSQWFSQSNSFDQIIKDKFMDTLKAAKAGECFQWRGQAKGRLAEVILLDQFSRNIFRGKPQAFEADSLALVLAQEAINTKADLILSDTERAFLYMPFMHSESLVIHEEALKLFSQTGLENNLSFEIEHMNIIKQFGRYPHRNGVLGRESSAAEVEFLKTHTGF